MPDEETLLWVEEMTRSTRDYVRAFPPPAHEPARRSGDGIQMESLREELEFLMTQSRSLVDAAREIRILSQAARAAALAWRREHPGASASPMRLSGRS